MAAPQDQRDDCIDEEDDGKHHFRVGGNPGLMVVRVLVRSSAAGTDRGVRRPGRGRIPSAHRRIMTLLGSPIMPLDHQARSAISSSELDSLDFWIRASSSPSGDDSGSD